MVDRDARVFRTRLTIVLTILGVLTAGSVLLFGYLLFKSLSRDVVNDALLLSRLDAERIARGVAEKSAGDPYIVKLKQTEIDRFVRQGLAERQILTEVQIVDMRTNEVIYSYGSTLKVPESKDAGPEGAPGGPLEPVLPVPRTYSLEAPTANPYDIEVPIGDFAVLRFGVSRKELAKRVEKLRNELYLRTAAAAVVSLLGIAAASAAVAILYRRTRRVEEARVQAERRAELGEVAAGLAHEIRNPLNAMSLNLELLEEQLGRSAGSAPSATVAAELAQAARQETGRLARLLTDFLAYARPSPIAAVPADLNEPAAEAVAFLKPEADKRGIALDFTPHPGGAPAKLDPARVKQVVLNLVGNALDAAEDEKAKAREVHVRVDAEGAFWRLVVSDHGPGLPDEKKEDLFHLFESTKPAGTGLGLPIADRIVRAHGGTLAIFSAPGEPTRAVATFPKLSAAA